MKKIRSLGNKLVLLLMPFFMLFQIFQSPIVAYAAEKDTRGDAILDFLYTLSFDDKGQLLYNGKVVPTKESDLELVKQAMDLSKSKSINDSVVNSLESFEHRANDESYVIFEGTIDGKDLKIEFIRRIPYERWDSGKMTYASEYKINGHLAFCLNHPLRTPSEGYQMPYPDSNSIRNLDEVTKALYYGIGGPGSIFGDYDKLSQSEKDNAIIATSLLTSAFLNEGDDIDGFDYDSVNNVTYYDLVDRGYGFSDRKEYKDLLNKVKNSTISPYSNIMFSNETPTVKYDSDKKIQYTDEIEFKAFSENTITFTLPQSVSLINHTDNKTYTGKVTLKGGDKFHFEATFNSSATLNTGKIRGSLPDFTPWMTKSNTLEDGFRVQPLGGLNIYLDPANLTSLKVKFESREGTMEITKEDAADGNVKIPDAEFTIYD
ncbi:thioester domain-containing protein, partial [Bacillus cereus]